MPWPYQAVDLGADAAYDQVPATQGWQSQRQAIVVAAADTDADTCARGCRPQGAAVPFPELPEIRFQLVRDQHLGHAAVDDAHAVGVDDHL